MKKDKKKHSIFGFFCDPFLSGIRNFYLLRLLTRRHIGEQFNGTFLGTIWVFAGPLILLSVFAVVFTFILPSDDTFTRGGQAHFSIVLFVGLICHTFATGVMVETPQLIAANVNYVKKVIFPIEIMSWRCVLSKLFIAGTSFLTLLVIHLIFGGKLHFTILLLPLVWLPALFYMVGIGWILSGIGTLARDIDNLIAATIPMLLFISPVFFTVDRMPDQLRNIMLHANPLAALIHSSRQVLLWGEAPDMYFWIFHFCMSLAIFIVGYAFFRRLRSSFPAVL